MNSRDSNKTVPKLSYFNSLVTASVSGFTGAYFAYIFASIKKRVQTGQSIPSLKMGLYPCARELLRGAVPFAASQMPTAILQQMINQFLIERQLSDTIYAKAGQAFFAGAVGGVSTAIVENVMLQQLLTKQNYVNAMKALLSQGSLRIFRGVTLYVPREAIFGYCYLEGVKQAGDYVRAHYGANYVVPAALMVGAAGSLASHPFDALASHMQMNGFAKVKPALVDCCSKQNPVRALYAGGASRILLFTTGMLVTNKTKEILTERLQSTPKKAC